MGSQSAAQADAPTPSRLMMPANANFGENGRKARYGVAYLRSLAAHAGVGFVESSPDEDVDAVDVILQFGRASAAVQVKCSAQWKVGPGAASLALEPAWVDKWQACYSPVYVVLVKVPSVVGDWIEGRRSTTLHRTVAFGKRFDPRLHTSTIEFTKSDQLTSETLYDWRDEVYEFHETCLGGGG